MFNALISQANDYVYLYIKCIRLIRDSSDSNSREKWLQSEAQGIIVNILSEEL